MGLTIYECQSPNRDLSLDTRLTALTTNGCHNKTPPFVVKPVRAVPPPHPNHNPNHNRNRNRNRNHNHNRNPNPDRNLPAEGIQTLPRYFGIGHQTRFDCTRSARPPTLPVQGTSIGGRGSGLAARCRSGAGRDLSEIGLYFSSTCLSPRGMSSPNRSHHPSAIQTFHTAIKAAD